MALAFLRIPPTFVPATLVGLSGIVPLAFASAPQKAKPLPDTRVISFNRDIRPILSDHCFQCHGPDGNARKENLRLDTEAGIRRVFQSRLPAATLAFKRITATDPSQRMPPPGTKPALNRVQTELVRKWISQGAGFEHHWAFIAPKLPAVPKGDSWCRSPIDNFILHRLKQARLSPAPEATKESLIRRVTMDLTGLPPTLSEIDAFIADRGSAAYEKVVDRLLASPRFGERMVWEWLDAARYSDTNGFQEDRARPMWPWRDWVVNALNSNMPFDQFTVEQIAGDMLPNATVSQKIATGFNRNHMLNGEGGRIPEESRVDYVMDRVETTSTVWLGLTMGCSKCHDHKFDPLSQKDYYQLFAYFNNVSESGSVDRNGGANPVLALPTPEQTSQIEKLSREVDTKTAQQQKTAENTPERQEAQKQLDAAKKSLQDARGAVLEVMVMDEAKPRESHILVRGDYEKRAEKVSCGVPAVLPALPASEPNNRLGLARWLVNRENPLTARVAVNRIWQILFGTGLVKTAEDFGVQGEPSSHPELLDWLAVTFMDGKSGRNGVRPWDVKALIRSIVTSATYRQSSVSTPEKREKDPAIRLLSRAPRYRWPAFALRDQALALSGLLVERLGGPPVKPYQPEGVWEDFSYGKIVYLQDHGEALYRRSLYTFWRRSVAPTELFDTSARRVCTVRIEQTNTPLQSLTLLNDVTFMEAARKFGERMVKEGGATPESRIAWAFKTATAHAPDARELKVLRAGFERYLRRFRGDNAGAEKALTVGESPRDTTLDPAELAAYAMVASTILNLDQTLSKE